MADIATQIIELLEDVAGAEVTALGPEQIKHHAALPAEAHAEVAATLVHVIHVGGSTVVVVGGPAGADLGVLGGRSPY
jgi:hypothetical protein